jgi:FlaA1/EpsC-like NDP-sugar epimerase
MPDHHTLCSNTRRNITIISLFIFALLSVFSFGEIFNQMKTNVPERPLQHEFEVFQNSFGVATKHEMNLEERKNILVAGGTGYIGVHTIVTLLDSGYDVTVVDNLVNSSPEGLKRAIEITHVDPHRIRFFQVDLRDEHGLEEVFKNSPRFIACIHFAGLKAVGESVQKPVLYYDNNVGGTLVLLKLMEKYGCRSIIFSSSATVSIST